MITKLEIQGFKCFKSQKIKLGRLTLLAGANATGKSTVIQALLLLRQSVKDATIDELMLNGNLINIGTAEDALCTRSDQDSIVFSLTTAEGDRVSFEFDYPRGEPEQYTLTCSATHTSPPINLFTKSLTYLCAERLGPRLLYPMTRLQSDETDIGIQGEFTTHCLSEFGHKSVANSALLFSESDTDKTLVNQTRLWMGHIVPNLDIESEKITQADQVRLGLKNLGTDTDFLRPTNTGFGISFSLPIVVGALISKPDSIFIVENPEAHLHPASQSEMGKFLARSAAGGVQVIIETHSDHILNGIRIAVGHGLINADDVSMQFFASPEKDDFQVSGPKIDSNGRIDQWPAGFFDQIEKDLLELP